MSLKEKLNVEKLPRHIAIIMDGNGRWAKEKGEDRLYGHYNGVESVRNIVEGCAELSIQSLPCMLLAQKTGIGPGTK